MFSFFFSKIAPFIRKRGGKKRNRLLRFHFHISHPNALQCYVILQCLSCYIQYTDAQISFSPHSLCMEILMNGTQTNLCKQQRHCNDVGSKNIQHSAFGPDCRKQAIVEYLRVLKALQEAWLSQVSINGNTTINICIAKRCFSRRIFGPKRDEVTG